jgi:hypothetical protein
MKRRLGFAAVIAACVVCVAWADSVYWNPAVSEGLFTDGSSWMGGAAPGEDDVVVISNLSATVKFPSDVEQTKFQGTIHVVGPAPTSSDTREVVFDATGASFYYTNTVSDTHPFIRGWSYASSRWQATGNRISLGMRQGDSSYAWNAYGTFTFSDGILCAKFTPGETRLVQESGTFSWFPSSTRRFVVLGAVGNNITNTAVYELKGGTLNVANINMRPYSRFVMTGGSLVCTTIALLPNNRNTGNGFGAGPTEFVMTGGRSENTLGGIIVGQYGGANARSIFRMGGDAYFGRTGGGNTYGDSYCNIQIASGTIANSGLGNGGHGELLMDGSATISIKGRNYESGHYGDLLMATTTNCTALLAMSENSRLTLTYGDVVIASAGNTRGVVRLSGNAAFSHGGFITKVTRLGGDYTAEAALEISDSATYTTPKLVAFGRRPDNTYFERIELVLNGGALVAGAVEGSNTLTVVAAGGVLKANAATTAEAPFLHGVKSFSGADGAPATVIIDTQSYDTYVDQDFGAGVTVVKRGSGTLYVKNSSHAKTVVEAGSVVFLDESKHFGEVWEVTGGKAPFSLDGATDEGEALMLSFATEAAARDYLAEYQDEFAPSYGYGYSFAVSEDGEGLWRVTVTTSAATPRGLVWNGPAGGGAWSVAGNWLDGASAASAAPTHNDATLVEGDAAVSFSDRADAHSMEVRNASVLSLTGTGNLNVWNGVAFTNDAAANIELNVENDVTFTFPTQSIVNLAPLKTGAGRLTLECTKNVGFSAGGVNGGNMRLGVKEGTLVFKGTGARNLQYNGDPLSGTCWMKGLNGDYTVVGTSAASSTDPELVLDGIYALICNIATGAGSIIVGNGTGAASARHSKLLLVNKAGMKAGNFYMGSSCTAEAWPHVTLTNSMITLYACFYAGDPNSKSSSGEYLVHPVLRLYKSSIGTTGGGHTQGFFGIGPNLDARIEAGSIVSMNRSAQSDYPGYGFFFSFAGGSGEAVFVSGSTNLFATAFVANNYLAKGPLVIAFDDGVMRPLLPKSEVASGLAMPYLIFKNPGSDGLEARAGGMTVSFPDSYAPYTIACPVRGVGTLRKRDSGRLVLGRCRTFASGYTVTKPNVFSAENMPYADVVTVQCAGGVSVEEGVVTLEAGATDASSAFTVASGAGLDLGGGTVSVGSVSGAGMVTNGTFAAVTLSAAEEGGETPTYENVAFTGPVVVDFGRDAENPALKTEPRKVAVLAENVTGRLAPGAAFRCPAVNTGSDVLTHAKVVVDGEGVAWAVPCVRIGFGIIFR